MTEKQTNVITINDIEYNLDEFTDVQKALLSHIHDLDRKMKNAQFQIDQLSVGRDAFINRLHDDLTKPKDEMVE